MIRKRSKFWTFLFAFIPGAGHMFMGFMKQGISLMSMFIFVIFIASWLNISPLMLVLPVLWFYSFFDAINKMSLPDEIFNTQEDSYLLLNSKILGNDYTFFRRHKMLFGAILVLLGAYLLWNNLCQSLSGLLPGFIMNFIHDFNNMIPQLVIGVIILGIGIRLVIGKRRESVSDDWNS